MPTCADCGAEAGTFAFCPRCGGTRLADGPAARRADPSQRRPLVAAGIVLVVLGALLGVSAAFGAAMPEWMAQNSTSLYAGFPGGNVTAVLPEGSNATVALVAENGTTVASVAATNGTAAFGEVPSASMELVVTEGNATTRRTFVVPDGSAARVPLTPGEDQAPYVHPDTVRLQRVGGIVGSVLAALLLWGGIGACVQRQRPVVYSGAGIGFGLGLVFAMSFTLPGFLLFAVTLWALVTVVRKRRLLR